MGALPPSEGGEGRPVVGQQWVPLALAGCMGSSADQTLDQRPAATASFRVIDIDFTTTHAIKTEPSIQPPWADLSNTSEDLVGSTLLECGPLNNHDILLITS